MEIINEVENAFDLNVWSGGQTTLSEVIEMGKAEELMEHLEDVFYGSTPTGTDVNDYLWFSGEYIIDLLKDDDEEEELEN